MSPLVLAYLVAGLILLFVGAEALVRGASRLALGLGVKPLVTEALAQLLEATPPASESRPVEAAVAG